MVIRTRKLLLIPFLAISLVAFKQGASGDGIAIRNPATDSKIPAILQQISPFEQDTHPSGEDSHGSVTLPGDSGFTYSPDMHSFTLTNSGSPKINTIGNGATRSFTFTAPGGARQDAELSIEENANPSGPDSAWTMETEILFFPRRVQPSVRETISQPDGIPVYEVSLPTGEKVLFDKQTKEILSNGSVLVEAAPIDPNANRQARKFAELKYLGFGITVRSDQRGESPRSAVVWGQKKMATITWLAPGTSTLMVCKKVSVADIWQQSANEGGDGLFGKDDDFFAMLNAKCQWNVKASDFP